MKTGKARSILVLDDESFMRKVLSHQLGELGFTTVTTADTGEAALRQLDSGDAPQAILLDLNMPGMDGVEFIRALVARRYAGALILVSGESERVIQTVEKLAAAHGIAVLGNLQKPVSSGALEAMLNAWTPDPSPERRHKTRMLYNTRELRAAIEGGELINYYQPKVAVETGAFVGAEVLVRWRHPRDGLVYPDQFIPLAEEHGLMNELTRTVLAQALRQASVWRDAGLMVRLAVNISMANLDTLSFPDDLAGLAAEAGVSTHEILLEVTESRLMQNLLEVLDILSRLRLKRFGLAIDDFGTGHSSLAQLRDLPFDQLKIDQGFVRGAHASSTKRAIFSASLAMGEQLGMETVAEGVEDRADWTWLRRTGCDVAQGYFIAKPMPADALPDWLASWRDRILKERLLDG